MKKAEDDRLRKKRAVGYNSLVLSGIIIYFAKIQGGTEEREGREAEAAALKGGGRKVKERGGGSQVSRKKLFGK